MEQLEGGRHAWQWLARRLWPVMMCVLWQRREMCGRRRREDDKVPGRWGRVPEVRVRTGVLVLGRGRSGQRDVARGARRRARLGGHVRVGVHAVVALARERRRALADGTVRAVVMAGTGDGHDGGVVREEVRLGDGEVPVEDVEELALDAADIALAKDAGAERPVDVLEGGVVEILVGYDERPEEDALAGPLLEGDLEVGLCAGDVDEGDEEGGDGDFCATDDVGDELGKLGVLCVARQGATAGRGRGPAEGVVDSVHDVIHNIFKKVAGHVYLDELESSRVM